MIEINECKLPTAVSHGMPALITYINIISFDGKSLGGQGAKNLHKNMSLPHMEKTAFQIHH